MVFFLNIAWTYLSILDAFQTMHPLALYVVPILVLLMFLYSFFNKKCCTFESKTMPCTHLAHCVLNSTYIDMSAGQHVG